MVGSDPKTGEIFRIENPNVKPNFSNEKHGKIVCETLEKIAFCRFKIP
jgi:hypothetical protein